MVKNKAKKTLYIIEDDYDILSLLSLVLKKQGFEIIMDLNGDDFDVKRLPCPDLYIIDINLFNKNGADLCSEIKNECPDIPVILMSAHVNLEEMAKQHNADSFMTKPLEINNVLETLTPLLFNK